MHHQRMLFCHCVAPAKNGSLSRSSSPLCVWGAVSLLSKGSWLSCPLSNNMLGTNWGFEVWILQETLCVSEELLANGKIALLSRLLAVLTGFHSWSSRYQLDDALHPETYKHEEANEELYMPEQLQPPLRAPSDVSRESCSTQG